MSMSTGDVFYGTSAIDNLDGGDGNDTVSYAAATQGVRVDLVSGAGAYGIAAGDHYTSIENAIGGSGTDSLVGSAGNNALDGGAGDDVIIGNGGADLLTGGAGADRFTYNAVADSTKTVTDTITDFSQAEGDRIDLSRLDADSGTAGKQSFIWIGNGSYTGVAGEIRYLKSGGTTMLYSDTDGDGVSDLAISLQGLHDLTIADVIGANSVLTGTEGPDVISGTSASDTISGLGGNDVLSGLAGGDVLKGGLGADILTGGTGADTFVYETVAESTKTLRDRIMDFSAADGDKIDLSAVDASTGYPGNQDFQWRGLGSYQGVESQLRYSYSEYQTIIYGDINRDGVSEFSVAVNGLHFLTSDDFIGVSGSGDGSKISGTAGAETLTGSEGVDWLEGGAGDDVLIGGGDSDALVGGLGADRFVIRDVSESTKASTDRIADFSQTDGDKIDLSGIDADINQLYKQGFTWIGTDAFTGTAGQLRYAHRGDVTMVYGDVDGDGFADLAIGLNGLHNLTADDVLVYEEPDAIIGTAQSDTLVGTSEDDIIIGRGAGDLLTGGGGNDRFVYEQISDSTKAGADVITDFNTGDKIDLLQIDANISMAGQQGFFFIGYRPYSGTAGELRAVRDAQGTILYGDQDGDGISDLQIILDKYTGTFSPKDVISSAIVNAPGTSGNDEIHLISYLPSEPDAGHGYDGDDIIWADEGQVYGDAGNDILHVEDGGEFYGGDGNDQMYGGDADDIFYGDAGADVMSGGGGTDTVTYAASTSRVEADLAGTGTAGDAAGDSYAGIEILIGSDFDDILAGDAGFNRLYGQDGDDVLMGRGGMDYLYGSGGADIFAFEAASDSIEGAADRIFMFEVDNDRFDLSAIDADPDAVGNQSLVYRGTSSFTGTTGEVRWVHSGSTTLILADVDGDLVADLWVNVNGLHTLTESHFIL